MSWLFSRALVEEFSEDISWDGRPSAPLSVMPTPHKFWRSDRTIKPCDLSRFGLTCEVLTEDHGMELLTSFLAASRARTSLRPEKAKASMARAPDSGVRWRALLARFDPTTSTWRTAQSSLLEGLDEFSETWPRLGSMRNGESFLRPTLELPIFENASGYWPTPTVFGNHNQPGASAQSGWGLSSAVKLWPTPKASDDRIGMPERYRGSQSQNGRRSNLNDAAARFPTPIASDWRSGKASEATRAKNSRPLREMAASGGALNPTWVEWLMGWPIGWTALQPLEMGKFHEWRLLHSQHFAGEGNS